ncbi:MAG: DUF5131 family protein [Syntrophorhabdales bacterium]|jgi:protein gp37
MEEIPVKYISMLPEVQPRVTVDPEKVAEYASLMREGVRFPPIVVFSEGEKVHVLADGFHRLKAALEASLPKIDCDVRQGSLREAQLFALRANAAHGLPLTQLEKRNAVEKLLKDDEWRTWSDGAIARWCGVSGMTVGRIREKLYPHYNNDGVDAVRMCSDKRVMRTGGIGKGRAQAAVTLGGQPSEPRNEAGGSGGDAGEKDLYRIEPAGKDPRGGDLWEATALDEHYEGGMNTTNDNVEWAGRTWNPITGCRTECEYCYARNIAGSGRFKRIYPVKFEPCFHKSRIDAPVKHKPSIPSDFQSTLVFTCSMADLFGWWVPDQWIHDVVETVKAAPWWTFIILTKYPERMAREEWRKWPDNAWVGATVDHPDRIGRTEQAFDKIQARVKFVSCEPLGSDIEELHFQRMDLFQWVIVGGRSAVNHVDGDLIRHIKEDHPCAEVVESLVKQARDAGARVYLKPNIGYRPREYPWQETTNRAAADQ